MAANCIIDASKLLNQYNKATNEKDTNGEDTFVQHFLSPWINNIFFGSSFGRRWANSLLASQSPTQHYPDFLMYTLFNDVRYDLFVVEVKPPGPTQCQSDQRKLAFEMQKMLNVLVTAHIPSPVVYGVQVDGFTCSTYKMDIEFDGLYRFVELNCFELPHTINDTAKAKYIFAAFMELKGLCDDTAEKIEVSLKQRRVQQQKAPATIPPVIWTRNGEYAYVKVKKSKHT